MVLTRALFAIINGAVFVFDTNIVVAAFRSRAGASFRIMQGIVEGQIPGLVSVALMLEYEDVLSRDEQLQYFWRTQAEVEQVLNVLALRLEPVATYYSWRPILKDPKDEHVLECALNGRAKAIVTFNTRDFEEGKTQFGIEILTPDEFEKRYLL